MRQRAFTLIELLVVVTIIILLLALLMPALGKARQRAQEAICMANLKQIGYGTAAYLVDNRGRYPSAFLQDPRWGYRGSRFSWVGKRGQEWGAWDFAGMHAGLRHLNRYIGGPYGPDDEVPVASCPVDTVVYDRWGTSYSANNVRYGFYGLDRCEYNPMRVKHPSMFVVHAEVDAFSTVDPTAFKNSADWHGRGDGQFFATFADYHVAMIPLRPGQGWSAERKYTFAYDRP